jgi:hypothetical protein
VGDATGTSAATGADVAALASVGKTWGCRVGTPEGALHASMATIRITREIYERLLLIITVSFCKIILCYSVIFKMTIRGIKNIPKLTGRLFKDLRGFRNLGGLQFTKSS